MKMIKMKKVLSIGLVLVLASSFVACGSKSSKSEDPESASDKKVTIIVTNGKAEIAVQFAQAVKEFMVKYPDITVEAYSDAVGDTVKQFEKLTASGKKVTIAMMEPNAVLDKYKDFGMDLTSEQWNKDTAYGFTNAQGQVVGFPFAIEGLGLVYNQKVLDKAVGGTFDPFSINTRDKLKTLLEQIQKSGVKYPLAYQTEAWSVGNHYSSQFLNQASDPNTIITKMKDGTFDFANNETWNGYYDTLDLLISKKYNKYGTRPLGQYYDDAHLSVGKGECAILFNGNWAYDSLKAVAGDEFGFMPVPVDNNPDNELNNKIVAGATQVLVVNKEATAAEQDAAKKFLNWLVYDEAGQDFVVNKSQIISAFKNNTNKVNNPLGVAIAKAIAEDKTMPFSTNYVCAPDYQNILGPEIQKYIGGKKSRADLAKVFKDYYKTKK